MTIDHSLTYKKFRFRNIPHLIRLKHINYILKKNILKPINNYADFGCSNGYLTNIISKSTFIKNTYGFDSSKNIEIAKKKYPKIKFSYFDLNIENKNIDLNFEFISCFETLEHVGNRKNALLNLKNLSYKNSMILITVPIEIGFIGIFKYIIKRFIFRYKFSLNCSSFRYFLYLLSNKNISKLRLNSSRYSDHFGFDYRSLDEEVVEIFKNWNINTYNKGTTRFYILKTN